MGYLYPNGRSSNNRHSDGEFNENSIENTGSRGSVGGFLFIWNREWCCDEFSIHG